MGSSTNGRVPKKIKNIINKEKLMVNPLNGDQVREYILKQGYSATEGAAYAWGNITEAI